VHAKLEAGAESALKASHEAMEEITGAIISITLVMAAVFIPVTFITGPTGVFYEQFGVTLIVAIIISAVNALTLSPALCALFLKPQHGSQEKKGFMNRFYSAFNTGFTATTQRYVKSLSFLLRHKWIVPLVIIAAGGAIYWASTTTPTGFVPNEDRGIIFTNVELPAGASLDRTVKVTEELYARLSEIPGVSGGTLVNGFNFFSGAGSNYALGFIKLAPWADRRDDALSADAIMGQMFQAASQIPGANILFFAPPSVPGFGVSSGFELQVLDRLGGNFKDLEQVTQDYLTQLMQRPEILYAQTAFHTNYPQYEINLNVPKAKEAGVSISSIFGTLQGYIGGVYAADFARFGKQYRVYVQALPEDRANTDNLNALFVRNAAGQMAPITEFVELKRVYGPQAVTRFNLFNSATVNGSAA